MILTVTMNPSIDISYPLDELKIDTVNRVVELLEKGAEPQGEEKGEELFPDHALGDITGGLAQQSHGRSLHILSYR